jgi:eukaryotic-like serine/threonine-protein kinase
MAMLNAPAMRGAPTTQSTGSPTLRSLLEARRAEGRRMSLDEAIAVIVPLCLDLQARHARGEMLLVHPSAIAPGADGLARFDPALANAPSHPYDASCLAPELMHGTVLGDACSTVFSLGAILYEMITGMNVGPAMRRPREIEPSLPDSIEVLIGKAIIGDRHHRPADLGALASAMYHVAPKRSIHPPEISAARLDASAELEVDVRFSMLPPTQTAEGSGISSVPHAPRMPRIGGGDPFAAPIIDRTAPAQSGRRVADDPTSKLAAVKAALEADPRPRYVVNKDKMDHGPFTAVELLQQIASHAFVGSDGLRDEISGQALPISEWEEFAPFADQAHLLREKRAEQKAVVRAADADKKRGIAKSILAVSVVIALAGVLAVWFFTRRGTRKDEVVVSRDRAGSVEVNGDIKGKKHAGGGGGGHVGGGAGGGYSGGMSYEAVLNGNNEQITMGENTGPDLTNAQLAGPLRHASFVTACGAPDDMKVQVRVAVRMGAPIGVTVATTPPSGGVSACIDRAVRGLRWPQNAKTDFVTTNY